MKAKEQTGFLIPYFMLPAFEKLGAEAAGKFVLAMGHYSQDGIQPDFGENIRAEMLWCTAGPWLDSNKINYAESRRSKMYSGWCSSLSSAGKEYLKIEYSDWCTAREQYDEYLERLPPDKKPVLFTDWLQQKRDRAKEEVEGVLPWDNDPSICTG